MGQGKALIERLLLIGTLALTAFLGGCVAGPRSTESDLILPPIDTEEVTLEENLAKIQTTEYQFPKHDEYVLGPGDVLSIRMIGRPDIFGDPEKEENAGIYTLSDSPTLYLPYIGAVSVRGKTAQQFQGELQRAYATILKDPSPVVTVEKYSQNEVAVVGSVKNPGRYAIKPGDTLLEAIFRAGGLTMGGKTGDLPPARVMKVFRDRLNQQERQTLDIDEILKRLEVDGQLVPREEIDIPLDSFILGGDLRYNIPLQPNDIVFLPQAGTVTVIGQVERPRVVFLGPGLRTMGEVLNECGGLKYRAHSRVEVVRMEADGSTDSIYMDARAVMTRRERDLYMQDNDNIYVYTDWWNALVDSVTQIFTATATTGINATYTPGGI